MVHESETGGPFRRRVIIHRYSTNTEQKGKAASHMLLRPLRLFFRVFSQARGIHSSHHAAIVHNEPLFRTDVDAITFLVECVGVKRDLLVNEIIAWKKVLDLTEQTRSTSCSLSSLSTSLGHKSAFFFAKLGSSYPVRSHYPSVRLLPFYRVRPSSIWPSFRHHPPSVFGVSWDVGRELSSSLLEHRVTNRDRR